MTLQTLHSGNVNDGVYVYGPLWQILDSVFGITRQGEVVPNGKAGISASSLTESPVYINNTISCGSKAGPGLRLYSRSAAYNTTVTNCGIGISVEKGTWAGSQILLYNNTVRKCTTGISVGSGLKLNATNNLAFETTRSIVSDKQFPAPVLQTVNLENGTVHGVLLPPLVVISSTEYVTIELFGNPSSANVMEQKLGEITVAMTSIEGQGQLLPIVFSNISFGSRVQYLVAVALWHNTSITEPSKPLQVDLSHIPACTLCVCSANNTILDCRTLVSVSVDIIMNRKEKIN